MISKADVKKLANLSRIEVGEEESEKLAGEIDSILNYVGQIKEKNVGTEAYVFGPKNVMRDDVPTNTKGEYTDDILKVAPQSEDGYLVVKKIL